VSNSARIRRSPLPSIGVGLVAAVVGAVAWAAIVEVTHYELGVVAVGLGLLVGLGMSRTAVSWRPLPVVGAVLAVAGCALGGLFSATVEAADVSDLTIRSAFGDVLTDPALAKEIFVAGFDPIDVVFWAIAAWAAFRMIRSAVSALLATPATAATADSALYEAFKEHPTPGPTPGPTPAASPAGPEQPQGPQAQ
jgi:hypothetical protein